MAFDISHTADALSTTDASSYNFTAQSFGALAGAGDTRSIAVTTAAKSSGTSPPVTAVTIGGVTASSQVSALGANGNGSAAIWNALVPTGTTGTVAVTLATTVQGCCVNIFRVIDASGLTAFATATDITPTSGVLNLNVNIPTGGGAVAVVVGINGSTTTWVGLTETSDSDDLDSGEITSSAMGTTAGTPQTITATNADTTPSDYFGVVASWEPAPVGGLIMLLEVDRMNGGLQNMSGGMQ